jgi:hypothetical protein
MDEQAFRDTLRAIDSLACVFRKPILTRCCACRLASKMNIAEREAVHCSSAEAYGSCKELAYWLRENSRFALHITHPQQALPHGQIMRIFCGGLLGLQRLLALDQPYAEADKVADVRALVEVALARYESLADIPYRDIVPVISHYQWRRRPT